MSDRGFRVALVTSGGGCPRWMWNALQAAGERAKVVRVLDVAPARRANLPWVIEAYAKWERSRYLPADSLAALVSLNGLAATSSRPGETSTRSNDSQPLGPGDADVVLVSPGVDESQVVTSGLPVWSFRFGPSDRNDALPGFWEVAERSLSMVSLVERRPGETSARVLETIVGRTDVRSWVRNQLGIMAKASDLLERWLPPQPGRAERTSTAVNVAERSEGATETKGSTTAVIRLLGRFAAYACASAVTFPQWQLAIAKPQKLAVLGDVELVKPPRDRFWGDPFLFERNGTLHVFVEEYLYSKGKGHIAMLSRDPSGQWSEPMTVIERPYHMSYPLVFEHGGELLLLPETTAAGRIELYRCVDFPSRWELDKILIDNFAGVDATLLEQDGVWWMFVDSRDELYIYRADSPRGPWIPHRRNPVKSDARSSRPAGRIFRAGDDVIRPSQDCSIQHGRQVVFNKIVRLSLDEFEEVEIGRLRTPWNGSPCHTYDHTESVVAVDRLVNRRR